MMESIIYLFDAKQPEEGFRLLCEAYGWGLPKRGKDHPPYQQQPSVDFWSALLLLNLSSDYAAHVPFKS